MKYQHEVDKKIIPVCNIMGVNIAAIDMKWLMQFTQEYIAKLSGDYMCVSNVHTTVMAYENKEYCDIQNGGIMAIPDGGPLSSIGRKRGCIRMERITGPDYLGEVLKVSVEKGYRHFFYGSTDETLDKLKKEISYRYHGIKVVGMYSPPFRPLTDAEEVRVLEMINMAKPDFVWVGLGAPKQEQWMAQHQGKVCGFMVGVGAAFDYLAGNIKRAPAWMQNNNLEWLYRLVQDPKRLFMRYFVTNSKFILNAVIRGK